MKIRRVAPWIVTVPGNRQYVFVQVESDEGITGWGEITGAYAAVFLDGGMDPRGEQEGVEGCRSSPLWCSSTAPSSPKRRSRSWV
jgi:hypothetical protein